MSCLGASCTNFDHRSLEGILLIVVQCKHAALSHCHVTRDFCLWHMHAILAPPALACAKQRSRRETRMNERRERRYQQEKVQRGRPDAIGDSILPDCGRRLSFFIQYALEDDIADSPVARSSFLWALGAGIEPSGKCTGS
jgi:hypothetical protein